MSTHNAVLLTPSSTASYQVRAGKVLKTAAIVLTAMTLFVALETLFKIQVYNQLNHSLGTLPFPQTQLLIHDAAQLASTLKIVSIALASTTLLAAASSAYLLRHEKTKEKPRYFQRIALVLATLATFAFISGWVNTQGALISQHSIGKLPIPGISKIAAGNEQLATAFFIAGGVTGGLSLGAFLISYLREEKLSKATLCKKAALFFLIVTGCFILESLLQANTATSLNQAFGKIPLPAFQSLISGTQGLADHLKYGAFAAAGVSFVAFMGYGFFTKKENSEKEKGPFLGTGLSCESIA